MTVVYKKLRNTSVTANRHPDGECRADKEKRRRNLKTPFPLVDLKVE